MSRWSSKPASIEVGPARVCVIGTDQREVEAWSRTAPAVIVPGEYDTALVEGVRTALVAAVEASRGRVEVFLASALLRFQTVPWITGLTGHQERREFARTRIESMHGAIARQWAIELTEAGFGRAGLAVAADRALVDAIVAAAANAGVSSLSVQPMFARSAARMPAAAGARAQWLVSIEPESLLIALIASDGWVLCRRMVLQPAQVLAQIVDALTREALLVEQPLEDAQVTVDVGRPGTLPSHERDDSVEVAGYRWPVSWTERAGAAGVAVRAAAPAAAVGGRR